MSRPSPVLLWFRKDLRLADNRALQAAIATATPVIPVYIHEPADTGTGPMGQAQAWWLHHSLESLDRSLQKHGLNLVLKSGKADQVLEDLIERTGADTIHWNRRYDPSGMAVDAKLKADLAARGLTVQSHGGFLLHEPTKVKTASGGPFRVYTPFWRALEAGGDPPPPIDCPSSITGPQAMPDSEQLKDWQLLPVGPNWAKNFTDFFQPGEAGAQQKLKLFIGKGLSGYRHLRDFPALPHTSLLSPHLALGEITPAQIWHATLGLEDDIATEDYVHFRKELVWREFSYHLLSHFPKLASENWNSKFDAFPWGKNDHFLSAWQKGMTGYPIVDAGMRQLWRHGIMHNRVRMITASFLIKDLMIDWREGEAWFADTLLDADPASNAASWQWVAGSGADAAPFFRIFNPVTQGEKFDPDGDYIRAHVPELARLPNQFIHKPFEAPEQVLKAAGVELGKTYPKPLVDHKQARETALKAFKDISGQEA
ncbi:DNA photolyase family protein [Allorhizobium sp. BGMRC 0089]|uniref:cryptochrome/photolyase family protein n=1 Tax=Allorhizobium sonneratiae TaxID=2934936 RepID=UPI0020337F75|nr:deoxyribodipyrimidine photo-lyase [Allorhizobium sonneratiae]MCM2293595.1 DNA photolyase family protein [Allorhizobium sonneratiae]